MLLFKVFLLSTILCFSLTKSAAIILETTNGFVNGLVANTETTKNTQFYAFQGIPYAKPPVGNLRFRSPECGQNWTGIYNATYEKSICTQTANNNVVGSENCLFLNIYTPEIKNENIKRATIVWIHGGGFVFGSGDLGLHGADYFIDSGVIFVSINYRLGVFGFLSTKDNAASGNWGLKDQVQALRWIQKNIIYFGGHPNNITIMGESAGSASVEYLIQSELARGLFKAAISESGSTLNPWSYGRNERELAFRIGLANLIITSNPKFLVEGLRKINAGQLQKSTTLPALFDLFDPLNGLPFAPVIEDIEVPDAIVTKMSYEAFKYGQFNRVPLLHGFNSLEARIANKLPWYGLILLEKLLLEQYNVDASKLTPKDMNASNQGNKIVGDYIKSYYFQNKTITAGGTNLIKFVSDDEFVRGIVKTAELYSKYAPCYLYKFSFTGSIAHQAFSPEGVSHAEELDFLFKNPNWTQNTTQAITTVKRMVGMWSNFAKYNNPTAVLNQVINVKWPLVNASGCKNVHYLDINVNLIPKINPEQQQLTLWDSWYDQYGYQPYNTY